MRAVVRAAAGVRRVFDLALGVEGSRCVVSAILVVTAASTAAAAAAAAPTLSGVRSSGPHF